jgi:hypothetical protein
MINKKEILGGFFIGRLHWWKIAAVSYALYGKV